MDAEEDPEDPQEMEQPPFVRRGDLQSIFGLGRDAAVALIKRLPGAQLIRVDGRPEYVAPSAGLEGVTPEMIEQAKAEARMPAQDRRIVEAGPTAQQTATRAAEVEAEVRESQAIRDRSLSKAQENEAEAKRLESEERLEVARRARADRLNPGQERTAELVALIDRLTAAQISSSKGPDPAQVALVTELRAEVRSLREQMERERTQGPRDDIMASLMKTAIERLATPPAAAPVFQPADAVNLVKTLRDVAQPEGVRATDQVLAEVVKVGLGKLRSGDDRGNEPPAPKWWQEPLADFLGGLGEAVTRGLSGLAEHPAVQDLIARRIAEMAAPQAPPDAGPQPSASGPATQAPEPPAAQAPETPPAEPPPTAKKSPWLDNVYERMVGIAEATASEQVEAECRKLSDRLREWKIDTRSFVSLDVADVLTNLRAQDRRFEDDRTRVAAFRFQAYERERLQREAEEGQAREGAR